MKICPSDFENLPAPGSSMDSPASVQAVPVPPAAEPLNYIAAARQGRQDAVGDKGWDHGDVMIKYMLYQ